MKPSVVLGAFCAVSPFVLPLVPARAVVLQQKWQSGQQLSYATNLSGTANITLPATANFPLAGVPLEVPIKGNGVFQLQTLSVDEAGVGTLAVRVPQFNLSGQAFGQSGQLTLQDATSKVTLNGRPIKVGDGTNPLAQPPFSVQISPQGRFVGYKPLTPKVAAPANAAPANAAPVDPAQAIDRTAAMAASIMRALPTLWPGRDVAVGESWKVELAAPTAAAAPNAAPATATPAATPAVPIGTYNMTLKGEEVVEGRTLQRVGVVGKAAFDTTQLPTPQRAAGAGAAAGTASAKQDVRGDLWIDAAAGQIVKANLNFSVQAEGGQNETEKARVSFFGVLQMNLNK